MYKRIPRDDRKLEEWSTEKKRDYSEYTRVCTENEKRVGRVDKRLAPKGRMAPYAPEWITVVPSQKRKEANETIS
ncbi:hypothetical protein ACI48J_14015 [Paenibacillus chitinolyticus]|uniref:hypothetical protein n=1 Tax=Paenibacillus chitinolyticus TaxID=79263 RepID=UPI003865A371